MVYINYKTDGSPLAHLNFHCPMMLKPSAIDFKMFQKMNPTTSNYNPSSSSTGNTGYGGPGSVPNYSPSSAQTIYNTPSWRFTTEELLHIPSLKDGFTPEQELKMRQQAAVFIQEMGDRLNSTLRDPNPSGRGKITQFSMCVAMVHLHRFFVIHSMRTFDPRDVAAACLFLSGKGEECPRKLEHIVNVWFRLKNRSLDRQIVLDHKIVEQCSEYIVLLESIVLQTIGFILQVDLPHPLILAEMNKYNKASPASRSLTETAYYFATDILMVTDWCVRYSMKTLACVCIHIVNIWAQFEIPHNSSGEPWFKIVDPELTEKLLLDLANKFSVICASDKAHFSRKAAERQAGLSGGSVPRPPVQSTSQQQTPAIPSRSTTPKLLPPPPAPPSLASNATGPSPKRKHEPAGNGNEIIKSQEVGTPPSKQSTSLTFKKEKLEVDSNFIDEWAQHALEEEQQPVKQKKKLGLSEYKERMSQSANGAMSASSDGGASSEAEVMSSTSSTGGAQQGRLGSAVMGNSPKMEEVKPRRSFMPDISKAAELVTSDTMQLPAGIMMAEAKKKPTEKKRESTSSRQNSNSSEQPSGNRQSSSSSSQQHPDKQPPGQCLPVNSFHNRNHPSLRCDNITLTTPSSSVSNNLPFQAKSVPIAHNRPHQPSSYKAVPPVERASYNSSPALHNSQPPTAVDSKSRVSYNQQQHESNTIQYNNPGAYSSSSAVKEQPRFSTAKSQQFIAAQPPKHYSSNQQPQQVTVGGYSSPPSPLFESISPPPPPPAVMPHYQNPPPRVANHITNIPYHHNPPPRMLARPPPQGAPNNNQFNQKKYQPYSNELEDGELT
uniref:Cyclin-like domain-containing protein n=1 Tax=Ditylenchus dipsaci TaxID=166011 RepID=A0A915E867_9BILA